MGDGDTKAELEASCLSPTPVGRFGLVQWALKIEGVCVCPCVSFVSGFRGMRAVPMEGQDQEDSALLVTQGSLVHQSIPTFIGMSGPGIQSALLPFFFLKAAVGFEWDIPCARLYICNRLKPTR